MIKKQQWKYRHLVCIRVILFYVRCYRSFFCYLLHSCAICHESVVLQLVTTQSFCNLPLSWCATCRSFVLQLVTTQPFCDFVTSPLFDTLSPLSRFCNLPLGGCVTFRSVVVQLVTTRLFCNLLPLSYSETCHHSVPQFITTHLFCKLAPLGCCATSHHSALLQLVSHLVRNLSLGCCATRNSFVLRSVHVLCTFVTCVQRITQQCNLSHGCAVFHSYVLRSCNSWKFTGGTGNVTVNSSYQHLRIL